jgi:hypothetical protein
VNPQPPVASSADGVSRRDVLRIGGLAVSMSAVLAACGSGRTGSAAPGRLGVAPARPTLPESVVDDAVRARTMQSIEYTAIEVYKAAKGTGALSAGETKLVDQFVTDHGAHAAALGALIPQLGGAPFACPNPFLMDRAVAPILAALDGSDDLHRDLLNIAHAFETFAGASYQALVATTENGAARTAMLQIGGEEQRHSEVLARAINPDKIFSPSFFGEPVEKSEDGFIIPYAIPAVVGRINGIDLVVGKRNVEGARFATQLQTPAANTFVYADQTC